MPYLEDRDRLSLGKRNNQNLTQIPHHSFGRICFSQNPFIKPLQLFCQIFTLKFRILRTDQFGGCNI
ncbi:MAG TPA: hypothetical protein V6D14_05130 [Coleofasciculaceae cyanobacterium]